MKTMGIYIKSLDIPPSCIKCPLHDFGACWAFKTIRPKTFKDDGRPDFCPLVKDEWMPIKEHNVDTLDHVLVTVKWSEDDYEVLELDYYMTAFEAARGSKWSQNIMNHITAWKHMPEPYRGGVNDHRRSNE